MDFAQAVDRHLAAVTERDLETYLASVHEDVTLVMLNGRVVRGRREVGAFHENWFVDPDWSWQLSKQHSSESGDTGIALFTVDYHDVDHSGKPYSMRYLLGLTFARTDGTWLLLHDQNTPVS
ncbi:hypothetical protein GCM10010172_78750 [Paractinoplanes ferrugineus]|uniref:SnoaL-like domain-containing protein n=1 Tax=Paractinoplanes ferrugineus TaxID=113564 RepID=A0A919MEM9_9ACTN|nr:nuclear transport factor 2 family protein [Actinoplanes ferrugineus]GIE12948.1 hypothetical protein Afe05nite_47880 [Actinoplanes ferrugineus]